MHPPPPARADFGASLVRGTNSFSFEVTPTLATRYQIRVLPSATATTPLATSASTTLYVLDYSDYYYNIVPAADLTCSLQSVCTEKFSVSVYSPPSAIRTEMAKQVYLYLGADRTPAGAYTPLPASLQLATNATISRPQLVADNEYRMAVSYSFKIDSQAPGVTFGFCTKQAEEQDGIGLPGPSACGSAQLSPSAPYIWGVTGPLGI